MISLKQVKKIVKKTLSQKRYEHTICVKNLAVKLAKIYKCSEENTEIAALLHDIAKETSKSDMLQLFEESGIMPKDMQKYPFALWHAKAGAIIAKLNFGIESQEILSAIECHTTGKINMSMLDKIIYIADMASTDREYAQAQQLRQLAAINIDKAVVQGLALSISWLKAAKKPIDERTIEAYKQQRKIYYGGN